MGAEGTIGVQRVLADEYLISANPEIPQFVVRPGCTPIILPLYLMEYKAVGCLQSLTKFTHSNSIDVLVGMMDYREDTQWLTLTESFAVIVNDSEQLKTFLKDVTEIGAIPAVDHMAMWEKIVPGRYIVTEYYATGGDCYYFNNRWNLSLGEKIKWDIWT